MRIKKLEDMSLTETTLRKKDTAALYRTKSQTTRFQLSSYSFSSHKIDVLVSGVGMTSTAFWMGKSLAENNYQLVLNLGFLQNFLDYD